MVKIIIVSNEYVIFHLGASSSERKWKIENWKNLIKWVNSKGFKVFLTGIEEDYKDSKTINLENIEKLFTEKGSRIDLRNFASLAKNSSAFVGGDTGLTHLADAIGARVLGLYGTPHLRFFPYNSRNYISRFDLDKNIKNILVEEVILKLEEILR